MNNCNQFCQPVVRVSAWSPQGVLLWTRRQPNTLTYAAADLMARAITGGEATRVTHLYARFGADPASNVNQGWLDVSDLKTALRSDFLAAPESPDPGYNILGGLWVPLLAAPAISATGEHYQGNRITYYFRIPASLPEQSSPVGNYGAASYIYALGLAAARAASDRTQDIILSVMQTAGNPAGKPADFTAFPVPPGGQVTVDYPLPFTA